LTDEAERIYLYKNNYSSDYIDISAGDISGKINLTDKESK